MMDEIMRGFGIGIIILETIVVVVFGLWYAITAPKEYNWVRPPPLQPPRTIQPPVKNPLSIKSRELIPLLLFALVIPGCARMNQRVKEIAEFKTEMKNNSISEVRLAWHSSRDNVIAVKESEGTIKVSDSIINISRWRLRSYPVVGSTTFITFWNGEYHSKYTIINSTGSIRRRY